MTAAQHYSSLLYDQQHNITAVYCMTAAQHYSSLLYDQQDNITAVYCMASSTT
jgi:hypothetical protein